MRTVTELDRAIGRRILAARRQRGVSSAELARSLSVSVQQMQKYEHGLNRIAAAKLVIVSQVLNVSLAELAGIVDKGSGAADATNLSERGLNIAALFDSIDDTAVQDAMHVIVQAAARRAPTKKSTDRIAGDPETAEA